jgi:hypothetical protein
MGYTAQQFTVIDATTYANWASLGSTISAQILAMGWAKTTDTGQAVWGANLVAITAASLASGNTTYTYTLTSGPGLGINNFIVITGMSHSGNNGTFKVASLGSGTFTVSNSSGVTATESGTGNSAVPTSTTSIYEIWEPQDALQTGTTQYFLKLGYGTTGGEWEIYTSLSTGMDGAGNQTGTVTSIYGSQMSNSSPFSCESDFSGDTGRMGMILGRSGPSGKTAFAVERTLTSAGVGGADSLGAYGVTLFTPSLSQVTLVFGVGVGPVQTGIVVVGLNNSELFNGTIAISPAFPVYGRFGNPHTVCGACNVSDAAEGLLLTTTLYGSTRTYVATRGVDFGYAQGFLLMRYD